MNDSAQKILSGYKERLEEIIVSNLKLVTDRFRERPNESFINTKLNLVTGEDFVQTGGEATIYHNEVIYSWIQGRGLEALAGHLGWLESDKFPKRFESEREILCSTIRQMLSSVAESMEKLRAENNGRVSFMMSVSGQPLKVAEDGCVVPQENTCTSANYTDIFYAKGLFCAGRALGRDDLEKSGIDYLQQTVDQILEGNFISDQQPMDPKNKVTPVAGKLGHGPMMISLGGATLMLAARIPGWEERSEKLIRHIFEKHINRGRFEKFSQLDFFEFIKEDGTPWTENNGAVLCDPGHALEFIGLGTKVLLKAGDIKNDTFRQLKQECLTVFPELLAHIFRLGFNPKADGICKAFDLASRQAYNSDMPWWSLPETMRATALVLNENPEKTDRLGEIFSACAKSLELYLNEKAGLMCIQTRNEAGNPVDVIPALPDADPCYHTGLSLLDAIAVI